MVNRISSRIERSSQKPAIGAIVWPALLEFSGTLGTVSGVFTRRGDETEIWNVLFHKKVEIPEIRMTQLDRCRIPMAKTRRKFSAEEKTALIRRNLTLEEPIPSIGGVVPASSYVKTNRTQMFVLLPRFLSSKEISWRRKPWLAVIGQFVYRP